MYLYHATRTDFTEFRLNGDTSHGVNPSGFSNTSGYGIYMCPEPTGAEDLVDSFYKHFQHHSLSEFAFLQNYKPSQNTDYTPFLNKVKSEWDCEKYGPELFLSIDGQLINEQDYKAYLTKIKKMQPSAVYLALKKCTLSKTPLSKKELVKYISEKSNLTPIEIEPVATHFAGKTVLEKVCAVPFKGRVLKVKLADDALILDDSKTIAENNCPYDLEKICEFIQKKSGKDPYDFAQQILEFYRLDHDAHSWRNKHSPEIQQLFKKSRMMLSDAVDAYIKSFNDLSDPKTDFQITPEHKAAPTTLILTAKKCLKTLLDHSKYKSIQMFSHSICRDYNTLTDYFGFDGLLFRDYPPYKADVYCVRNLEKLKIESYKPYGSDKWIPIKKTLSYTERLARFRNGGIEE